MPHYVSAISQCCHLAVCMELWIHPGLVVMISESSNFQAYVLLFLEAAHIHISDRSDYLANVTQAPEATDGWSASRRRAAPRAPEGTQKSRR
jgi:hypothetical protein